jgi:membrane-associated phospholipid phosphatase
LGGGHAGGAGCGISGFDGCLYQAVTGGTLEVKMGGIFVGMWLLVGVFWAAQDCSARQQAATDAKENGAPRSSDSPGNHEAAETRRTKDTGDLQQSDATGFHRGFSGLTKDFLGDQKQIWTSPAGLRFSDTEWLVPLSGITAGLFVTDRDFSKHLSQSPTTISHYKNLSNAGVGALIGGAGGMWLLGHASHNEHWSETGFLAGEAALNSLVAVESFKYSLRRERPYQGNGSGSFFQSGGTSFPSEHAAAAWSVAGVIAHEYPGPLTKIMAYGLASLVDISRVRAQQHFPSDVVVGAVIGNLIAQNIYSRHHNPDLGGSEWRSISQIFRGDGNSSPANQGSPYVPMDSWVYPAFDRLAALGYVNSGIFGMRPWTRLECARLLGEAGDQAAGIDPASEAQQLLDTLQREFSTEAESLGGGNNRHLQAESVYTRFTGISGQPLTDGYHFGQTILNDYGRPFAEGVNNVTGFSGWASEGRLVAYVRGEYQHAPSSPALSAQARQFIAGADTDGLRLPVAPNTTIPAVDQVQLLDAYLAMNFENWQASFGKQSLWWGPSEGGPILFSDNAVPVTMFRINRVSPFKLPSVLGWMGPTRLEFFMGQLTGHDFMFVNNANLVGQFGRPLGRQPFIHGEKLSFKPTPNFEFSVSETTVFAGGPIPLNGHYFFKSYTGFIVPTSSNEVDVTDARSGIDFTYRIPWLRKWLTFYGDAFSEDEYSPLGYPRKSAFQGGIYMPRIPGISKLDLRVEGGSTSPVDFPECNGCFYQNQLFINSYTNGRNLMGTWVGRASQAEQAWSTYWLSARNKIQFNYRHRKIDGQFLPQGGTVNDAGVRAEVQLNTTTGLSGSVQYEKWNIPILASVPQSNVTASVQVTYWPKKWK